MLRNGDSDAESYAFEMDNLVYDYHPQKQNQLMKVFDSTNSPQGFKDDGDGSSDPNGDDYAYDENGNMTPAPQRVLFKILVLLKSSAKSPDFEV